MTSPKYVSVVCGRTGANEEDTSEISKAGFYLGAKTKAYGTILSIGLCKCHTCTFVRIII